MKAHHHYSHCSYLGYEFAKKQHTPCRSAPSNRSVPLLDYFEGTSRTGDVALGAASPLVANRTYSTQLFKQKAISIVHAHAASSRSLSPPPPLFLFVSLSATHKPYLAPMGLVQRATLAHSGSYFHLCPWVEGSRVKCRSHHRKGYEAMAVGVDDLVGEMRVALVDETMWDHTLMIFASDNGGPIGPQASNAPLRGGKDTNLEGGVRTLAALGGGWLPHAVRGGVSHAFMHESDWYATLAHAAGVPAVDTRAAALGLPPVDGRSMWASWNALLEMPTHPPSSATPEASSASEASPTLGIGPPRTLVLATRFGLPGTPYGGTSALIDVPPGGGHAYKLIRGVVCECPECRPCLHCNGTGAAAGCVFDVVADPTEQRDLAKERPELLAQLHRKLDAAMRSKFVDVDPVNQECWHYPRDDPDHWMEVALARGAVMQPFLKAPTRRGAKPRMLYPGLKHKVLRASTHGAK